MVPVNIIKIIISDLKKGINVNEISRVLGVNQSTIYRIKKKYEKTGILEGNYEPCGKKSELDEIGLEKLKELVLKQPDITIEEIRQTMNLSIKKSQISYILRNKLGFRFKKRWFMLVNKNEQI